MQVLKILMMSYLGLFYDIPKEKEKIISLVAILR